MVSTYNFMSLLSLEFHFDFKKNLLKISRLEMFTSERSTFCYLFILIMFSLTQNLKRPILILTFCICNELKENISKTTISQWKRKWHFPLKLKLVVTCFAYVQKFNKHSSTRTTHVSIKSYPYLINSIVSIFN